MLLMPIRSEETTAPERTASKFTAATGVVRRAADPLMLVGGALLAYRIRYGSFRMDTDHISLTVLTTLFGLLVFGSSSLYRSWRGRGITTELVTLSLCWSLIFAGMLFYATVVQLVGELSRLWLGAWAGISLGGAAAVRLGLRGCAAWVRARGMDLRTAVIVGGNPDAQRIVEAMRRNPWMGIKVVGWFATSADRCALHGIRPMGRVDRLAEFVESRHIDQVWIALPMREQGQIAYVLRQLDHSTADIKLLPDLFGLQLLNHSVEQIGGLPVLNLRSSPLDGPAHLIKATMDKVLASLILIMISPLMIAIAIGVKLSSPGPIFFRQLRNGLGGKPIEVWKFRSMRVHQEAEGQVTQASKGDSRVTPFGAFLRRTSLDELPQFINVLQGSMSIVGPRPHAIAHNEQYKTLVDRYMQRHRVKPGITGWAQINGLRGETDTVEKMARRVEYDLYYMQNWSPWFDLRIILLTVFKGFVNKNAY
ncbi:undecaprenyl-phosphate glucose phosphotransferase [Pseudoxanthomonas suwonensis]|uniref:undecaprenyl-phosphate glucose phosphotransferase n=1 Tax=Pseudoxanthomonas suwonensis TaxID=314722 RepID=UPI00138F8D4C|nr:undecaprenyl-phosphate glucose phosphotransferase [Pseudoxanthomonas suwonensis]KAF1700357.1 undecaprenyl-phosphate glucose phosphotransferase [Pseudoxanthomonas suwonensis]